MSKPMPKWKLLFTAALAAILLAGCMPVATAAQVKTQMQPQVQAQVQPDAGQWRTWVLTSPDQFAVAAPPDPAATAQELQAMKSQAMKSQAGQLDAKAQAAIEYWDAGSPNYRWEEIALNQLRTKPMTNPRANRAMALMNVAIYDAMIAAWRAKYAYNRLRPSLADAGIVPQVAVPNSPSYPSEQAVAAGAAAAILGYLYPDDAAAFDAKASEAAHSRVLAGVNYPSDAQAGLDLGRQVAQQVIARAKADGADAVWDGKMPTGPGHWTGQKPIEPLAGTWRPWVLTAGDEFRAPLPLAYDSPEKAAEIQQMEAYTRTWQTNQKALFWQTFDGIFNTWYDNAAQHIFEHHWDTNPPKAARIYADLSVAHDDAVIACWDSKYTYWAPRPFQLDPKLVTLFPSPNHPSYPAAHGCASGAISAMLAYLFPEEADAIMARGEEAASSRMWAGIHFPSDIKAGLALGRAVAQKVISRDREFTSGAQALVDRPAR